MSNITDNRQKNTDSIIPALCDYLRVVTESWDDDFINCTATQQAADKQLKVCYSHDNRTYGYDWSYIGKILRKGSRLNIIKPVIHSGIIYPELIIFEPDYLVDISAIARCFTNYAESPLVHLLYKLQPSQNTEPIVLGNFASQLLDEQIHKMPESRTYKDSVSDFWKNNSISILTAGIGQSFHHDAQQQKENIAKAISETLPECTTEFSAEEGILEPSFFSEMLGLQGRMDYLQLDFKLLLEQKSGKGEFPYGNFEKPRYREEHYVQMLMYMMIIKYNFSETYTLNHQQLSAFLLYSKYRQSLVGLGFEPELIFRAIKVRNELAQTEMQCAGKDGYKILEKLTADSMNLKGVSNNLWTRFQRSQIDTLLLPVHQATELEKAYYFRFLTFISCEHVMSKLGNGTQLCSGFASTWLNTLDEKLLSGNIYDSLTLVSPDEETEGRISSLTLRFSEKESNDMSNFRVGDIVILYPYDKGSTPDARKAMVFRCSIENIETDTLHLALRAAQTDAKVFLRSKGKLWAIEHDFVESSFGYLYRGMHAFLSAPKQRKELILLQRKPETSHNAKLNGDYGRFNELSLRVKAAKDIFLIIGPPGTGKTSYGMLNTVREELTEADGTVILLSYTNRAVDEICSKLFKDNIDFIRIGGEMTCSPEYRDNLLTERAKRCTNISELKQVIHRARVFVATTTAMNSNIALFQMRQFTLAVIDEASQILEPHIMGILSASKDGKPAIRKIVMIGDHKQLPAVVQQPPETSLVTEPILNDIMLTDCRISLFERLLRKYHDDKDIVYMLTRQGRMHNEIAEFPNLAFYGGKLDTVPLPHQCKNLPDEVSCENGIDRLLQTKRIMFINTEAPSHPASEKVNQNEADIIAATVLRIYHLNRQSFSTDDTIGIIVPYRNQISTIRNTIDRSGIKELHGITIDTVERFQGSQRKYIIYGFTVQNTLQLEFLTSNVFEDTDGCIIDRKLNVAMTRAKEHLIMVGNARLLSEDTTFSKLISYTRDSCNYIDLPLNDYVSGRF